MKSIPSSHLKWLKDTNQPDAPSFFETFGYNREEGRRHYLRLISWTTLAKSKRQELGDKFRQWEANDADQYWLLRQSESTKIRVATAAIKESESVSVAALQNSTDSRSHGKDAIDTTASVRSINTTTTSRTIDSASTGEVTNTQTSAGQKHPRDSLDGLDEAFSKSARNACLSDESRPSSELLRTPLQSPTPSEPASPVRPLILPEDGESQESLPVGIAIQHHGPAPNTFFTSTTEHQHREYLLQALYDGKQLPHDCNRPDYTFTLPLGGKDWGARMTRIYDATRQNENLTFRDLNEIAILSGVLHVDEEHAHLSKDEILQIRRDVLQTFYTNEQQEEDLKRSQAARDHWATWCEIWSSIELSASLAADRGAEGTLDTTPIIDSIMAAYGDCKAKNILPVLFMALHVFRKFNTWSKLRSEADCAMAMVGPILEEVLQIQHEVKFTSANFTTAHGQERKQGLGQHGSSRQPDIVGCTPDSKEVYFGELKGIHAAKQDVNVDTLRLAIFAKDALDHLHCSLVEDPPLLTFQTKGKAVVFYLATKQGNAIVHVRVSSVLLPSKLTELSLNLEFFFRLFQVQTLLETTRKYLKNRREKRLQDSCPFPTLGTPERLHAMRSPSKVAKSQK